MEYIRNGNYCNTMSLLSSLPEADQTRRISEEDAEELLQKGACIGGKPPPK